MIREFGVGERVRFLADWPSARGQVYAGDLATVFTVDEEKFGEVVWVILDRRSFEAPMLRLELAFERSRFERVVSR